MADAVRRHVRCAALSVSIATAGMLAPAPVSAQQSSAPARVQIVPLTPETLYQGWRASRLLGSRVVTTANEALGNIRNLLIGDDGQIRALIVESAGSAGSPEFFFRLPWEKVDGKHLPGKVIAGIESQQRQQYGLFPATLPGEFAVSEVIGDYARLQAGQAYGYVSDVVFTSGGKMIAVLVSRDAAAGGGTYAFGFPGTTGRWEPSLGYYGLPYLTPEQANAAAVRVDSLRFPGAPESTGRDQRGN